MKKNKLTSFNTFYFLLSQKLVIFTYTNLKITIMKIKNINIANSVINLSDKEKLQKINDLINEVIRISTETIEEIENNISTDNDSEDAQWDLAANEGRIMLAEEIQSILLK